MLPRVRVLMAAQHGLITHAQAVAAGLDDRDVARLLHRGVWTRVRRGVYVETELWRNLDPHRGQPLLRIRAVALTRHATGYAFSHDSAALLLGMGVPDATTALVHLTRAKVHGDADRAGVKHHLAPYRPDDLMVVDGLCVLGPARTALDMAREHDLVAGLACCDWALRHGVTRAELREVRSAMWCWPGSKVMDEAIGLADPGAESWLESRARLLVWGLGIGRPQTQFGLTDGHRTVWCDLRVGRHVFEADGRMKYQEPGADQVAARRVLWEEKRRQDFISGFKLGVSRITAHDCGGGMRAAVARLTREYADTCERFGTDISDLAPYIVRGRRR